MKDISRIKPEEFETLLQWLCEDREEAGAEYLKIREGLIRYFRYKGCTDCQTLADETLNRVAEKIPSFDDDGNVKKTSIVYGFAKNIIHEYLRSEKKKTAQLDDLSQSRIAFVEKKSDENSSLRIECLEECLKKLSAEEKEVFIEYYGQEKEKNSAARRRIAERLQCEMNTLQVRVFRLRGVLAKCIENCMKKKL